MFKTLYGKIVIILVMLFILLGLLYVLQTLITTKLYLQEVHQRLNRNLSEYLVTERFFIKEGKADIQALKDTFERLMHVNPNIELYLIDTAGEILAYSAPPERVQRKRVDLGPIQEFLEKKQNLPILGDDPRDPERKKVFSVAPIPAQGPKEGYLYIILGGEEYDSVVQRLNKSYILRLSTWIAGIGLMIVFFMGLLLFNLLTRRLRRLSASLQKFKQGDFQEPISLPDKWKTSSQDEIDRLGVIASQMSERIIDHLRTIQHVDNLRRELVSNVSHDLRTPLSSLQGYLETLLLKGQDLDEDKRREYLQIAMRQSQRLGNLITELFELAKLDSPDMQINVEPFNLRDLAQDIGHKYLLKAEKKEVRIRIEAPEDIPPVHADIALIERAIQNLIDNALSFSRPGGRIEIEIIPEKSHLRVTVKDDGIGIREEDIPFIFDRFYQGQSTARQEEDDSTGLGLAITKRILELHESTIEVRSKPDNGAAFTFSLPLFQT